MPGHPSQPAPASHRRSSGYSQYASHAPREDVRIADIGGGRAPTPSDRSQMNPILPEHNSNLPSISTRYNKEETRSPGRPSSRTSHSLPPPPPPPPSTATSFDRTEGYRYEPAAASRTMEMETAVNPEGIKQESKLGEDHFRDEKKFRQTSGVDEDYDESAADALLSMGNPQLGQKRLREQDHEESKRARGDEDVVKEEEKKEESKEEEVEEGEVEEEVKKEEEPKKETMADAPATSNAQSKEEGLANETAGSA